jgi:hypothetical protein
MNFDDIFRLRSAESRSISAENPDGRRGGGAHATAETTLHQGSANAARELGPGWKVSPCTSIDAGDTFTMADIEGPGVVRHIWIATHFNRLRDLALEVYYDDHDEPAIRVPLGDFFCQSWGKEWHVQGIPVNVNSKGGMNSYWPMPFRKRIRFDVRNDGPKVADHFFYTVNYTLEDVADDAAYLCASWRRENPTVPGRDLVILDGVEGRGHYVGCFLAWQQNSNGWWGEGEVKVFLDGDGDHPTICGTGTEDYFGGAWGFNAGDYTAPFLGFATIVGENEQDRRPHGHVPLPHPDPIHFHESIRITCQQLGWRSEHRYLPLKDDIAATAWWYQQMPHSTPPQLPDANGREQV